MGILYQCNFIYKSETDNGDAFAETVSRIVNIKKKKFSTLLKKVFIRTQQLLSWAIHISSKINVKK